MNILRVEREAIRAADLGALTGLADQKQRALARLENPSSEQLLALRQMATENERLLAAALQGVRAAQTRLKTIMIAARGFDSYDASGRRAPIRRDGSAFERRA
ncbi:hypothetical protein TP2_04770 [Thioclava pacifica DSM 10166]|uniref:FlgN-like protein n=2 Tax=Thioclava pacifica TaxID=285109 RepID=A0A074JCI6_9RHOB|nr:hypothetical protein TP2_04770 [Thioclava pacifica DSM 10166]